MEEKDTGYESGYSFAMTLLAELRQQYARQVKIMYVLIFVIAALLGYIFYDRWLDSQMETQYAITTENIIEQDNMTNSDGSGHHIVNSPK